MSLQVQTRQ